MKLVKELIGHSGCQIFLMKDKNEGHIIRKQSKDILYNTRLEEQIKKQINFYELKNKPFKVPRILREGKINEFYYADMEYVEGGTLLTVLESDEIEFSYFLDKIVQILNFFKKTEIIDRKDFFEEIMIKLQDIFNKIEINNSTKIGFYNFAISELRNLKGKSTICHGDLTLENIIVDKEDNLWLIDFLDNFYSHYYFDVAKIYQDLEGEWYKIKHKDLDISKLRVLKIKEEFDFKIKDIKDYKKYHYYFLALTFLRILPYSSNEKNIRIEVLERVEKYISK